MKTIPEEKRIFLFDFDGTLVDSMGMWANLDTELMRRHGVQPPDDLTQRLIPLSEEDSAKLFLSLGCHGTVASILEEIEEMATDAYVRTILPKPGAKELVAKLKGEGAKVGLLTASTFGRIFPCLARNGMTGWFDLVLSCGEYGYSKDDPAFYTFALNAFSASAEEAVFFDDNFMAIRAARSAGIATVGVFDAVSAGNWDKMNAAADMTVRSLEEFLPEDRK